MADRDVRGRGFAKRTPVDDALIWVDEQCLTLSDETISPIDATGRIVSRAITSPIDLPPFARCMMDGYALLASEVQGASLYNKLSFEIAGRARPGMEPPPNPGAQSVIEVATGAPLPAGTDAVLPYEKTERHEQTMFALDQVSVRQNVGPAGEDYAAGAYVLESGRRLRPQDIGLLYALGIDRVEVVRQPTVRILVTGNEILEHGRRPKDFRIVDSNSPMLMSLVKRDGGKPLLGPVIPDDPGAIRTALAEPADVILVVGGSSVGREDHAPRILADSGSLPIHGVAMRPSSPAGMGRLHDAIVFLLPGNPVSCLCAYDFFAGRAIRALAGRNRDWPYRVVKLPLERKLISQVGRLDYARVRIRHQRVIPLATSGASLIGSTVRADGFVIIQTDLEGFAAQTQVEVYLYD